MKARDRGARIFRWIVVTIGVVALAVPVCAAMIARVTANTAINHLTAPLLQFQAISFLSNLLPVDSLNQKPFPPEFYIVVCTLLILAVCVSRVKHHLRMLAKENEAREMRVL